MTFYEYLIATRKALSALTLSVKDRIVYSETRKALARLSWMLKPRAGGPSLREKLEGIEELALHYEAVAGSYLSPEDISEGHHGDFDCMNLLAWMPIVENSGVPFVPARAIADLSAAEMGALSGEVPQSLLQRLRIFRMISDVAEKMGWRGSLSIATGEHSDRLYERAIQKITDAMDTVSDNEMVRYVRCGATGLKVLAGAGLAGPAPAPVTFSQDLETGPGWIRNGNRRRIDVHDQRIIQCAAMTPENYRHVFVARPWVKTSRWMVASDPHRRNTPVPGPGAWPAEWRAFIKDGIVTGGSSYYSWAHDGGQEDACMALAVERAAQKIIDAAKLRQQRPAFFDVDDWKSLAAGADMPVRHHPNFNDLEAYLGEVPPGGYNCTLDFIETDQGPMFLEAGPPIVPFGFLSGAHPIGFSPGIRMETFAYPDVSGYALSTPADLDTTDIKAVSKTPREGHIFTAREVNEIAEAGSSLRPDTAKTNQE